MKDYYDILGVPESADSSEIKIAFRRLAFEHHPDKNPGNEKQAEERFKEINEAYSVLSDEAKRQEYTALRNGRFSGVGSKRGFRSFNQEDIFRETFSDRAAFDDLKRMFAQAGLRFDENFLNKVFFSGRGFQIRFVKGHGGGRWSYQKSDSSAEHSEEFDSSASQSAGRKPNFIERFLLRINHKLAKFILKKVFGINPDRPPNNSGTSTKT